MNRPASNVLLSLSLNLVVSACGGHAPATPDTLALAEPALTEVPLQSHGLDSADSGPASTSSDPPLEADSPSDTPSEFALSTVTVRPNESLVLFADWSETTAEALADLNGLDVTAPLHPGQTLALPVGSERLAEIDLVRHDLADGRLSRYLSSRGGLEGVRTHRVRTGDTAWGIAHEVAGVPTWVLVRFNEDVDLDRLTIGQDLIVPVLGDTVADEESGDDGC